MSSTNQSDGIISLGLELGQQSAQGQRPALPPDLMFLGLVAQLQQRPQGRVQAMPSPQMRYLLPAWFWWKTNQSQMTPPLPADSSADESNRVDDRPETQPEPPQPLPTLVQNLPQTLTQRGSLPFQQPNIFVSSSVVQSDQGTDVNNQSGVVNDYEKSTENTEPPTLIDRRVTNTNQFTTTTITGDRVTDASSNTINENNPQTTVNNINTAAANTANDLPFSQTQQPDTTAAAPPINQPDNPDAGSPNLPFRAGESSSSPDRQLNNPLAAASAVTQSPDFTNLPQRGVTNNMTNTNNGSSNGQMTETTILPQRVNQTETITTVIERLVEQAVTTETQRQFEQVRSWLKTQQQPPSIDVNMLMESITSDAAARRLLDKMNRIMQEDRFRKGDLR